MLLDYSIHQRLCERGLILLVMAVTTIADDIHKNILFENLSELKSQLYYLIDCFNIISIYVDYWGSDCFCHLCAVQSSPSIVRSCCKSDLVVSHNVDRSKSPKT